MLGCVPVTTCSAVVQMVIGAAVSLQVIGIVVAGLHVVVCVLIESAEGIAVVQLIVEASASFKVWVTRRGLIAIGDGPQRIGKGGLLVVALLHPLVIGSEEVGKQLQSSLSVGQVDAFVVDIATPLAAP